MTTPQKNKALLKDYQPPLFLNEGLLGPSFLGDG